MFYQKVKRKVQCTLCPHLCTLQEGKIGRCGVRQNLGGRIKTRVYGLVSGYSFDPIEKKPLYHFYPGKKILSIGSFGCNLNCNFCQNWQISVACQIDNLKSTSKTIEEIIVDAQADSQNIGIAFTYNEPTVWFEFMYDIAQAAKNQDLKTVMVSNGFINPEPLGMLLHVMDAFNIDLKAFSENFYMEMAGGNLNPVLESLKLIASHKKHLELTMLVIPGKNDDLNLFKEMLLWIRAELGENTVLHLSRYFPKYKQVLPPTSEAKLHDMALMAKKYLNFVYSGNVSSDKHSSTYCPKCNALLIGRMGYKVNLSPNYSTTNCLHCKQPISFQG